MKSNFQQPDCQVAIGLLFLWRTKVGVDPSNTLLLEKRAAYGTIDAMILPKFSLRAMLIATAAFAVLSLVLAQAVRGEAAAAMAFLIGASSIVLAFAFYCWAFAAAWACSALMKAVGLTDKPPTVGSPFANAGPPKQIITPVDPE